ISYLMICVVIFSFHVVQLVRQYLNYDTKVSIDLDDSVAVAIPGITLCFDLSEIIDVDRILFKYPTWRNVTFSPQHCLNSSDESLVEFLNMDSDVHLCFRERGRIVRKLANFGH